MNCSEITEDCIKQGESIEYGWGLEDESDLTGWTCYLQVRRERDGELANTSQEVTTKNIDNTAFIKNFTHGETSLLEEGNYIVGAELANVTTGQSVEAISRLKIVRQWVKPL